MRSDREIDPAVSLIDKALPILFFFSTRFLGEIAQPAERRIRETPKMSASGSRPISEGRSFPQAESARPLLGLRAAVLGSTSGIGRATALALADRGADVIVHGRTHGTKAEEVAEEIRKKGRRSVVLPADLADREESDRLPAQAWEVWNGLDAWLHFAGADTLTGPGAALDFDAKLELLLRVDLVASIRLCRAIGRAMREQGAGSIVTMGWDQAETGMEGDSGELFAATKGAVLSFTRSLSLSLAPAVRVNAVAPGWIKTAWGEKASEPWQKRVERETPLRRWGTADDVARLACFLVGPDAAFLTGQVFRVNGGAVR